LSNVPWEEAETDGGIPSCQGLAQAFSVGGIDDGAANVACGPHVIHSNAMPLSTVTSATLAKYAWWQKQAAMPVPRAVDEVTDITFNGNEGTQRLELAAKIPQSDD